MLLETRVEIVNDLTILVNRLLKIYEDCLDTMPPEIALLIQIVMSLSTIVLRDTQDQMKAYKLGI